MGACPGLGDCAPMGGDSSIRPPFWQSILAPQEPLSRAKKIERPTSAILRDDKEVINDPIFGLDTVCKWSQLTAQSLGMPSALERNTSEGIWRIVLVIGATVTSFRYSRTESRVRIRTGLILSGVTNLYQRNSPCLIPLPASTGKLWHLHEIFPAPPPIDSRKSGHPTRELSMERGAKSEKREAVRGKR
jgi:hypothetical protein